MIDVSLEMPDKVRELQIKLYRKAKNEPGFRFYQLYDQVYREDILWRAWVLAKANDGSPGRDDESFADIESKGLMKWLNGLRKDLHDRTYRPQPVRRVMVEKPGGGERPLGIPTIRDRVAQTAAKLVLDQSSRRTWSRMHTATGRGEVRRMRFRRWMSYCTRVTRISWTPVCRNTWIRLHTAP